MDKNAEKMYKDAEGRAALAKWAGKKTVRSSGVTEYSDYPSKGMTMVTSTPEQNATELRGMAGKADFSGKVKEALTPPKEKPNLHGTAPYKSEAAAQMVAMEDSARKTAKMKAEAKKFLDLDDAAFSKTAKSVGMSSGEFRKLVTDFLKD